MSKTFRPYEPDQISLMPASMRDWLPSDHLADRGQLKRYSKRNLIPSKNLLNPYVTCSIGVFSVSAVLSLHLCQYKNSKRYSHLGKIGAGFVA